MLRKMSVQFDWLTPIIDEFSKQMSELSLTLHHMPNADCKSKWSYLARHFLIQGDKVITDLDFQDQISQLYKL
jgi:hypothetical protein